MHTRNSTVKDLTGRQVKKTKTAENRKEKPPDTPENPTSPDSVATTDHLQPPNRSVTDMLLQQYQALHKTIQAIQGDDQHKQLALAQINGMIIGVQAVQTLSSQHISHSTNSTPPSPVNPSTQERPETYAMAAKRRSPSAPSTQSKTRFQQQKKEAIQNIKNQFGQVDYNIDLQFTLEPEEQRLRTEKIPNLQFQRELEHILQSMCNQTIKITKIWRLPRGGFTIQVHEDHVSTIETWSTPMASIPFSLWKCWTLIKRPQPKYINSTQLVIYDVDQELSFDLVKHEIAHNNQTLHRKDPNQCIEQIQELHRLKRWNKESRHYEDSRAVQVTLAPELAETLIKMSGIYLGNQIHYIRRYEKPNLKCFLCGRTGHIGQYCRSRKSQEDWADAMEADSDTQHTQPTPNHE